MNSKGFTLMEMLVTISILAIVLIISVSKVTLAIPNVKNEAYSQTIDNLKKAASLYIEDNKYTSIITSKIGNKCSVLEEVPIEITISSLVESGYVKNNNNLPDDDKNIINAIYNCNNKKITNYTIEEVKPKYILESPKAEYVDNCEMNKIISISNNIIYDAVPLTNPIYYLKLIPNNNTKKGLIIGNKTTGMKLFSCGKNNTPENCIENVSNGFLNEEMWYKIIFDDKTIANYSITVKDNLDFILGISDGINYKYSDYYSINNMDYMDSVLPNVINIKEYTNGFNININKDNTRMSCGISSYGISVSPVRKSKLNSLLNLECYTLDILHNNTNYSGNTSELSITSISHGSDSLTDFNHYDYCYSVCMQNNNGDKVCTSKTTDNVVTLKNLSAPSVSSSIISGKKKITINYDENILLDNNTNFYFYSSQGGTANKKVKKCLVGKTLCSTNTTTIAKNKWYKLSSTKNITITYSSTSSVNLKTYTDDGDNTLSNSYTK